MMKNRDSPGPFTNAIPARALTLDVRISAWIVSSSSEDELAIGFIGQHPRAHDSCAVTPHTVDAFPATVAASALARPSTRART